jgi:hypothetical protein
LASASEWLKTLAVLRVEEADPKTFQEVFEAAVRGVAGLAGQDAVRWRDLMRMLLTWALRRRPAAERDALEKVATANQPDLRLQEEIKTMTRKWGPTIAELAMAEGMAKGKREGELRMARDMLRTLLVDHFGAVPETLQQRIDATDDLDRLRAAVRQVSHLQKLEDLTL